MSHKHHLPNKHPALPDLDMTGWTFWEKMRVFEPHTAQFYGRAFGPDAEEEWRKARPALQELAAKVTEAEINFSGCS